MGVSYTAKPIEIPKSVQHTHQTMLARLKIDSFWENGFLRIPKVFSEEEVDELAEELDRLVDDWANTTPSWSGPWRLAYMGPDTERKSKLTAMHDLHLYSRA